MCVPTTWWEWYKYCSDDFVSLLKMYQCIIVLISILLANLSINLRRSIQKRNTTFYWCAVRIGKILGHWAVLAHWMIWNLPIYMSWKNFTLLQETLHLNWKSQPILPLQWCLVITHSHPLSRFICILLVLIWTPRALPNVSISSLSSLLFSSLTQHRWSCILGVLLKIV